MTTTETTEISAVDQVNHFFTTLLKLYLYCSENSVRISSHPSDFAEREIDYSPGSYLAYLDNEYDIPPFTLDDGNSTTSVHSLPSTLPFVHSHIVLLQTSREIQQEFADVTKSAMMTVHNGNFALHCKFTASDTEDILSSSELESVKLHGIDHFMLTHNWEHYARILAGKIAILDLLLHYREIQEAEADYDELRNEISLVLTHLDKVSKRVSPHKVELCYYSRNIVPLLEAAVG